MVAIEQGGTSRAPSTVVVIGSELVRYGVAAMMSPFSERWTVVTTAELSASERADIALLDVDRVGAVDDVGVLIKEVVAEGLAACVVLLSWRDAAVEEWTDVGDVGHLHKGLSGAELVAGLEAIRGANEIPVPARRHRATSTGGKGTQSAIDALSVREREVLMCVGSAMSNDEIASSLFLSINTIKSYIRSAYQKIGATSRSQAVLWTVAHGMSAAATEPPSGSERLTG